MLMDLPEVIRLGNLPVCIKENYVGKCDLNICSENVGWNVK
jgi:hypothetical protein